MQHMVQSMENHNTQSITTAAALVRSAWESLHQIRREQIAGKQRYKLDKREDDIKLRLLSPEEETKIQQIKGKGYSKCKDK